MIRGYEQAYMTMVGTPPMIVQSEADLPHVIIKKLLLIPIKTNQLPHVCLLLYTLGMELICYFYPT